MKPYHNRIALTDETFHNLDKYMETHENEIRKHFEIGWRKPPTYSQGVDYLLFVATTKKSL